MSGATAVALAAVIVSGVSVVASMGFNFWNASSERKQRLKEREDDAREWYRRTVFERRLNATQDAYTWAIRVHRYTTVSVSTSSDEGAAKRKEVCLGAREWYDANALFLYDSLPKATEFLGLVNIASAVSQGSLDTRQLDQQFDLATQEIRSRLDTILGPVAEPRKA